jgi:flavorubredoxin
VKTLLFLIYAVRLVGGHTHQAPANFDKTTRDAKSYFKKYFDNSVQLYGTKFAKYSNHCLIHLVDDVRMYNSSLGGLTTYKYESFYQHLFKNVSNFIICWCQ